MEYCDQPKSGAVNDIWLYTKRRFAKCVESYWINYFTSEFSPPDSVLETHYESLLVDRLVDTETDIAFVVTVSDIYSANIHLWKIFLRGYNQLCGFH